jgi:hypothetical protein
MEILSSWFSVKHIYKTPELKIGHYKGRPAVVYGDCQGPKVKQDQGFRRIASE